MKKTLLLFFAFIGFIKYSVKAQDLEQPGAYMTAIANAHDDMNKKYMAYMSAVAHSRRARKIEKMRQQVLESITSSRYKTTDLPIYKGDNSLRKSSLEYIQLCYNVFNEDYAKIVNMEDIAEQSYDEMQAYILLQEKTNEKIEQASAAMHKASLDFAARNNVKLIQSKDELSEKMDVAGKLNHYSNQVYLAFFKCNWEDGQIIKSIETKKVNDIEQGRSALMRYADEGLKGLDTLKSFEGDAALAAACKQALLFYKRYAENDLPKVTDYLLKVENFDRIKKSYDAKAEHKKEDVDAYNKAVNDINAAINGYNQNNVKVNNSRNEMIDNWNNTWKTFQDEHMPKYRA